MSGDHCKRRRSQRVSWTAARLGVTGRQLSLQASRREKRKRRGGRRLQPRSGRSVTRPTAPKCGEKMEIARPWACVVQPPAWGHARVFLTATPPESSEFSGASSLHRMGSPQPPRHWDQDRGRYAGQEAANHTCVDCQTHYRKQMAAHALRCRPGKTDIISN